MKKTLTLTPQTSVVDLLLRGCTITTPKGFKIASAPRDGMLHTCKPMIDTSTRVTHEILSPESIADACQAATQFERG